VLDEDGGAVLFDNGGIEGVNQQFDRIWIVSTIKSRRNNGNWSTGYIENLEMLPDGTQPAA